MRKARRLCGSWRTKKSTHSLADRVKRRTNDRRTEGRTDHRRQATNQQRKRLEDSSPRMLMLRSTTGHPRPPLPPPLLSETSIDNVFYKNGIGPLPPKQTYLVTDVSKVYPRLERQRSPRLLPGALRGSCSLFSVQTCMWRIHCEVKPEIGNDSLIGATVVSDHFFRAPILPAMDTSTRCNLRK